MDPSSASSSRDDSLTSGSRDLSFVTFPPPTPSQLAAVEKIVRWHKVQAAMKMLGKLKVEFHRRTKIARELLDTERSYLRQLNMLVDDFEQPLRSLQAEKGGALIPSATVSQIFPSVPLIRQVNSLFAHSLEALMDGWGPNTRMGNFFLQFLPTLRIYIDFVTHFDEGRAILTECMATNAEFNAWLTAQLLQRRIMTLSHLLIVPIQRIPRYRMLIAELVKHTPDFYDDHPLLQKAHDECSKIADTVDTKKKEAESILFCRTIAQRLEKCPIPVMEPGRRFVMEGPLSCCQLSSAKVFKPRWVVLFSDVLIIGRPKGVAKADMLAIPPTISTVYTESFPKSSSRTSAVLKPLNISYKLHIPLEQMICSERTSSMADSMPDRDEDSSAPVAASRKPPFLSFSTLDEDAWGFFAAVSEETRFWGERIVEHVQAQQRQKHFYEEQTIKVARSKAVATKNLLAERYAALRQSQSPNPNGEPSPVSSAPAEPVDPSAPKLRSFAIKRNEARGGTLGSASKGALNANPLPASALVGSSASAQMGSSASAPSVAPNAAPKKARVARKKDHRTFTAKQLKEAVAVSAEAPAEMSIMGGGAPKASLKKRIGRRFGSLRLKKTTDKASASSLFELPSSNISSSIEEPPVPGAKRNWRARYEAGRSAAGDSAEKLPSQRESQEEDS